MTSRISLNGIWKLSWVDRRPAADLANLPRDPGIDIPVPGDIHQALQAAGRIAEPALSDNVRQLGWLGTKEWWLARTFALTPQPGQAVELNFTGLDYEADVWLNGRHLAQHRNMFRPLRVVITDLVQPQNTLAVRLLPHLGDTRGLPNPKVLGAVFGRGLTIPQEAQLRRAWMRKAQYTFGWDWTQDVFSCGIWQDVTIDLIQPVIIEQLQVITAKLAERTAELVFQCRTRSVLPDTAKAQFTVELYKAGQSSHVGAWTQPVLLAPGQTRHCLRATISDPALWWPAEYGPQSLYEAVFRVMTSGATVESPRVTFGIRTVRVDESPRRQRGAYKFRLIVNGVPIYAKGADWVPADMIPARVPSDRRRTLLRLAREAHLNYLRVWGGGVYEAEEFYTLCDELGIMLWQDFMFSCAEYPDFDEEFMAEVRPEIRFQVQRLRNHPSLVIWCGNNEIDQQQDHHGARIARPNRSYYGESIFKKLIPEILAEEDPTRPYRNSSGCRGLHSAPAESPLAFSSGVTHFDIFDEIWKRGPKNIPSFINEWYGGAPPVIKSIAAYLPESERHWSSPIWQLHDFAGDRLEEKLKSVVPTPDLPFNDKVYYYQVVQAETVKTGAELLRKHKWENSGQCYWMFGDAYPGFTWSVVDYFLRAKPAYFAMKRAFQPLLPVAEDLGDRVEIAMVNDTREPRRGVLRAVIMDFQGRAQVCRERKIKAPANASLPALTIPLRIIPDRSDALLWMGYFEKGRCICENRFFLDTIRNLKIPLAKVKTGFVRKNGLVQAVRLSTDVFARNVAITGVAQDLELSDNYVDVVPGRPVVIYLARPAPATEITCDWENRELRPYTIMKVPVTRLRGVKGGQVTATVELYNPGTQSQVFRFFVRLPPNWTTPLTEQSVEVKPRATRTLSVPVNIPLADSMTAQATFTVGIRQANREYPILLTVTLDEPLVTRVQAKSGQVCLEIQNQARTPISDVEVVAAWETRRVVAQTAPPFDLQPGASRCLTFPVQRAQPYSFLALVKGPFGRQMTVPSWIAGGAKSCLRHFKTRALDKDGCLRAGYIGQDVLPGLQQSRAYVLRPDLPSAVYSYIPGTRAWVWLFLHYSDTHLFLHAFVQGDRFYMSPTGSLHQGSCVELGLSCTDQLEFELAMGLTAEGPRVYLRRDHGQPAGVKGLTPWENVQVAHRPQEQLVFYRFVIGWERLHPGFKPAPGKIVRCAFVFPTGQGTGVNLFQGIQAGKDIMKYGKLILD